ncbi:MAG: phosphatase PAP2 family protein, partial [Parachlamydiales bacterium]
MSGLPGLELIYAIQEGRTVFWDRFFAFLNFLDTDYFYLILILFLWLLFNWKVGFRMLFLLLFSAFINNLAKEFFQLPRPFFLDRSVELVFGVEGFGFPSGGAQSALLFGLVLAYHLKRPWAWPLVFFYAGLIGFSRLYLGLHFLEDVLGGYALGLALFLFYRFYFPKIESFLKKSGLFKGLIFAQMVAGLMYLFDHTSIGSKLALNFSLASIGLVLGIYFKFFVTYV